MKTTAIRLLIASLCSALITLTSCRDELDIQQTYDFHLTTMPIPKKIKQGETVEIRCQLNRSGHYKEARYQIGFFQSSGKGILRMDNDTVFLPNDFYPLERTTFRLYYTSQCTDQQTIDLFVIDSFGQKRELTIGFVNDSDVGEDYI